ASPQTQLPRRLERSIRVRVFRFPARVQLKSTGDSRPKKSCSTEKTVDVAPHATNSPGPQSDSAERPTQSRARPPQILQGLPLPRSHTQPSVLYAVTRGTLGAPTSKRA